MGLEKVLGNDGFSFNYFSFMNFLPIPALDGGHIMFVLYEMVSGKKPSDKFLEYAHGAGFILLISLFLYANGMDVIRAFS